MKKEFIKVNKTVFDYKRYIKEVEWLKYSVKRRLIDILEKDFVKVEEFEETFDSLYIKFYNDKMDLELEVECQKKHDQIFI